MQHHHVDEFSVTDVRHTLHEVLRILSARRWFVLFPFCIVATVAFICSLAVPRQWTSRTVIKREHDPVLATTIGKSWTQPYRDIRSRMKTEIKDLAFLRGVLAAANLPEGLRRFDDGSLAPESIRSREALARKIAAGLSTRTLEASPTRDVVEIRLTLDRPDNLPRLLRLIRDSYMRRARAKTVKILNSVERFLQSETKRCERELETVRRGLSEYRIKYPGIDPAAADPSNAEQTALTIERVDVERKLDDAALQQERYRTALARLSQPKVADDSESQPEMIEEPNPRYDELVAEIERLERQIEEDRTVRLMTEAHPRVKRNAALLAARRAELRRMPRILHVSAKVVGKPAVSSAELAELKRKLGDARARVSSLKDRLADIEDRLQRVQDRRALAARHRADYLALASEAERLNDQAASWRQNIAPVQHVLYLEDKDRGIHFTTVQDAAALGGPSSPDAALVMLVCLGLGLAAAILSVLLVELLDRSYRTVKQLTTSLGLPVIESIDEIMTRAARRRRMIRSLVVMPALATVMVTAMLLAGARAYVSLGAPDRIGIPGNAPSGVAEPLARAG